MRWPLQPLQPFQQTQLQPPFGQSVASLCHPWFTTTNFSYRFPIFETSATALCGTTGIIYKGINQDISRPSQRIRFLISFNGRVNEKHIWVEGFRPSVHAGSQPTEYLGWKFCLIIKLLGKAMCQHTASMQTRGFWRQHFLCHSEMECGYHLTRSRNNQGSYAQWLTQQIMHKMTKCNSLIDTLCYWRIFREWAVSGEKIFVSSNLRLAKSSQSTVSPTLSASDAAAECRATAGGINHEQQCFYKLLYARMHMFHWSNSTHIYNPDLHEQANKNLWAKCAMPWSWWKWLDRNSTPFRLSLHPAFEVTSYAWSEVAFELHHQGLHCNVSWPGWSLGLQTHLNSSTSSRYLLESAYASWRASSYPRTAGSQHPLQHSCLQTLQPKNGVDALLWCTSTSCWGSPSLAISASCWALLPSQIPARPYLSPARSA